MAEAMSGPAASCPWCSAPLADPAAERCPSCGAALASTGGEGDIKGVTTLDTEAILRARSEVARPRSRILSFITGEVAPETGGPASPESLAPPPDDVRREMLRLQLEAERADLTAETVALKSDELAKIGIPLSQLGVDEASFAQPPGGAPGSGADETTASGAIPDAPGSTAPVAAPAAAAPAVAGGDAASAAQDPGTADDPATRDQPPPAPG